MARGKNPSSHPWRLTARDDGDNEEVHSYRTRSEVSTWAMSYIRKHYHIEIHKYEHGQYVKRDFPQHLIDRAKREAY